MNAERAALLAAVEAIVNETQDFNLKHQPCTCQPNECPCTSGYCRDCIPDPEQRRSLLIANMETAGLP